MSTAFLQYRYNIECTKTVFLECPQYSTRYRIGYQCHYIIFSSKAGTIVPRHGPPSIESNDSEDHEMDFDDQRDYMDQDIPAGQFPTPDPGPIHPFLSGMPDKLDDHPSRRPQRSNLALDGTLTRAG